MNTSLTSPLILLILIQVSTVIPMILLPPEDSDMAVKKADTDNMKENKKGKKEPTYLDFIFSKNL